MVVKIAITHRMMRSNALEESVIKTPIAMAFTVNAKTIAHKRMKLLYARLVRVPPVMLRMAMHGIVPMANAEIVLVIGQRVIQPVATKNFVA